MTACGSTIALAPDCNSGKSPSEGLVDTCKGSDHLGCNATTASGRAENLMTPGRGHSYLAPRGEDSQ